MHQEMALGGYPTISLSKARRMAEEARLSLIQGINPMSERRERKRASNPEDRAFGVIALKWWEQQRDSWSSDHTARVRRWIQNDAQKISELAIGGAIRSFMPLDSSWNPAVVSARLSSAKQSTWC